MSDGTDAPLAETLVGGVMVVSLVWAVVATNEAMIGVFTAALVAIAIARMVTR